MNALLVPDFIADTIAQFQERQRQAVCQHEHHDRIIVKRFEGQIDVICKNCGATL